MVEGCFHSSTILFQRRMCPTFLWHSYFCHQGQTDAVSVHCGYKQQKEVLTCSYKFKSSGRGDKFSRCCCDTTKVSSSSNEAAHEHNSEGLQISAHCRDSQLSSDCQRKPSRRTGGSCWIKGHLACSDPEQLRAHGAEAGCWTSHISGVGLLLPVNVPVVDRSAELNETFIQRVRHGADTLRHDHFCLPVRSFNIHNVSLQTRSERRS